jgi:RHS repeat-associated protein
MYSTNYHFYNPKNYLYSKSVKGLQSFELDYRFSFNGKEKDNETYGDGNAYDFGARIYDSRLGRWTSVDPEYSKTSFMTPYHFALNNPIVFIDPDGNTEYFFQGKWIATDGKENNLIGVINDAAVAKTITENSIKGLKVPEIQGLKNGDKINGGLAIDKNVLAVSVEVLKKAMDTKNIKEEFVVAMDEKNGKFEQNGPILSNGGATEANGTARADIPPGKIGIHSHPMNDITTNSEDGSGKSSYAKPSEEDAKAFKNYEMNIIIGRKEIASFTREKNNYGEGYNVYATESDPVINIYGSKTKANAEPEFTIDGGDAKNIIKNGNSGSTYNKFKKNEVK